MRLRYLFNLLVFFETVVDWLTVADPVEVVHARGGGRCGVGELGVLDVRAVLR